jgi:hypothetical protein
MTNVWARRAVASAVFVLAAAIVYWAMNLPAASPVEDSKAWSIESGDEIVLIGPKSGEAMAFQGPVGKGVGVRFAQAALTPATASGLQALGIAAPSAPGPLQWITHDGGASRAMVDVRLTPAGPHPALSVRLTGGQGVAEVALAGRDANLVVAMSGAAVDRVSPTADVTVGQASFGVDAGGAFPLEVAVAPGSALTLRYAEGAQGAAFRWGRPPDPNEHLSILELAGVRLRRPGEADRLYACGAAPGAVAWRQTDVAKIACSPTLRLRGLDLSPDGGRLAISGSAYVVAAGEAVTLTWKRATENPLVSGLLGAAYAGVVGWTIRMLLGKPAAGPDTAARPRPRRRASGRPA